MRPPRFTLAATHPEATRLLLRAYPFRRGLYWLANRLGALTTPPPVECWTTSRDGLQYKVRPDRTYSLLFFAGTYEPDESQFLRSLLKPGDTFVDVGTNFGWYACLAGALVGPAGRVLAFEPLGVLAADARACADRNGLSGWVDVFGTALGDSTGELAIHTFAGLPIGHASASDLGRADAVAHLCPIAPLDTILARERVENVDAVKCDVEGYELQVLAGATRLLGSKRAPIVQFEGNPQTLGACGTCPSALFEKLRGLGYHQFFVIGKGGRLSEVHDPVPGSRSANYLATKESRRDRLSRDMARQKSVRRGVA